jgi:pSer/pThr/pTyr-binding forkhead associated (FHA) protein
MGNPVFRATLADGTVERELAPGSYTIGRSSENAIFLDDLSVSRRHARIVVEEGAVFLEDLGSSGGTMVSGHRLPARTRHLLHEGDSLTFGDVEAELSFAVAEPPAEKSSRPPERPHPSLRRPR